MVSKKKTNNNSKYIDIININPNGTQIGLNNKVHDKVVHPNIFIRIKNNHNTKNTYPEFFIILYTFLFLNIEENI